MKIKCTSIFQDQVLNAQLVQIPSPLSRDEHDTILEIDVNGTPAQIASPGPGLIIIEASRNELNLLEEAGYLFNIAR